jgi:hypothetical protein
VVHHAVTRVVGPIFEKRFSPCSFACRTGMGTHAAVRLAAEGARGCRFALKCDVRKYFASIDHTILLGQLENTIKCRPTLGLIGRILAGFRYDVGPTARYFPGDDLFTPFERRRGLPLGNQTSQFFANVYLNELDHQIREELRPKVYVRYVDDFVLFDDSKTRLREMKERIENSLDAVRLELHAGKSRIYRTADGVTLLGWRIFPDRLRVVRPNVVRFRRAMRGMQRDYATGTISWDDVNRRVQAWLGHVAHGNTWVLRERLFSEFGFRPRVFVGGRLPPGSVDNMAAHQGGRPQRPGRVLQQQCEGPPGGVP